MIFLFVLSNDCVFVQQPNDGIITISDFLVWPGAGESVRVDLSENLFAFNTTLHCIVIIITIKKKDLLSLETPPSFFTLHVASRRPNSRLRFTQGRFLLLCPVWKVVASNPRVFHPFSISGFRSVLALLVVSVSYSLHIQLGFRRTWRN